VTAKRAGGPVSITATSEGHAGAVAITVIPVPVASVSITPTAATLEVGQTEQLAATASDAHGNPLSGRTVTWSSSDTTVATVNATGLVTSVGTGVTTITASSEGHTGTSAITIVPVPA